MNLKIQNKIVGQNTDPSFKKYDFKYSLTWYRPYKLVLHTFKLMCSIETFTMVSMQ